MATDRRPEHRPKHRDSTHPGKPSRPRPGRGPGSRFRRRRRGPQGREDAPGERELSGASRRDARPRDANDARGVDGNRIDGHRIDGNRYADGNRHFDGNRRADGNREIDGNRARPGDGSRPRYPGRRRRSGGDPRRRDDGQRAAPQQRRDGRPPRRHDGEDRQPRSYPSGYGSGDRQPRYENGAEPRRREGSDRGRHDGGMQARFGGRPMRRRGGSRHRRLRSPDGAPRDAVRESTDDARDVQGGVRETSGILIIEPNGNGVLRREETRYLPNPSDVVVPRQIVEQHRLRDGSLIAGLSSDGGRPRLVEVTSVDGLQPADAIGIPEFKRLITIDPESHFCLGDATGSLTLRVLDVVCPIGRGQRGLIVAPPKTGKTILLKEFARGVLSTYPDVTVMVLLVDERPEEATDWARSVPAQVFAATADQPAEQQTALAEMVWKRGMRLVELGKDVVLLLDSITRLARAFNRLTETSGRTLSGGVDHRAMERPRQIFGAARNAENGGSLTILATALIETGSRMDELIFQEFKGTGNAELVLSRKLAEIRVFPAIDIAKSGTRKEEKLLPPEWLKRVHMLRRVVAHMKTEEAMEKLVERLSTVKSTEEFLQYFEVG